MCWSSRERDADAALGTNTAGGLTPYGANLQYLLEANKLTVSLVTETCER